MLLANHLFCHQWRYFENIMKEMVAFFLSKGIVKGGELIIYLFFAVTYFCWSVDVFVVIVVVAVCLIFMLSLFYVAARFQASTS